MWLQAPAAQLAGAVGDGTSRPLLAGDPAGTLDAPRGACVSPSYEAAARRHRRHRRARASTAVVDAVLARSPKTVERVREVASASISVIAATTSSSASCARRARRRCSRGRRARCRHAGSAARRTRRGRGAALDDAGVEHATFTIGDGEDAQDARDRRRARERVRRSGACCAATRSSRSAAASSATPPGSSPPSYYRGIDVVQVPDHAAGDGRRVDRRQDRREPARGQEPRRRVPSAARRAREPAVLATLPDREYRCGLGEVAKYALIGDDELLACSRRTSTRSLDARPGRARAT